MNRQTTLDFGRIRFALATMRDPGRWLAGALAAMMGAMALILAGGFIDRTMFMFREDIIRSHYGHLQVLASDPSELLTRSRKALDELTASIEARLAPLGPVVVAPRSSFVGLISRGERTVSFLGEGVEPERERDLSRAVRVSEGRSFSGNDDNEVLLGEGLAKGLGAKVGDKVALVVNTPGGGVNALEVTVTGIFHSAAKAYDDRALRLPLSAAWKLNRSEGVSRLLVLLPSTDLVEKAARLMAPLDAPAGSVVRRWSDLADFYNKTSTLFDRQLAVVRWLILAIVLLAVGNAMMRSVLERTREIGTMMALGRPRKAVIRRFVLEGVFIGACGASCGVLLGTLLALAVSAVGIPMPPPPGTSHGFLGGIDVSVGSALRALGYVSATALVAAFVPALMAARLNIVDALRCER